MSQAQEVNIFYVPGERLSLDWIGVIFFCSSLVSMVPPEMAASKAVNW